MRGGERSECDKVYEGVATVVHFLMGKFDSLLLGRGLPHLLHASVCLTRTTLPSGESPGEDENEPTQSRKRRMVGHHEEYKHATSVPVLQVNQTCEIVWKKYEPRECVSV